MTYNYIINFDDVTKSTINKHYPNWAYILEHLHKILTVGGSESGKTTSLINFINCQPHMYIIYNI